ncbi:MAG: hypothetical protein J0L59_08780 [Xanthomonadales bacterium]|nr:hypothetical protein [Xanthomonadales bacterium]
MTPEQYHRAEDAGRAARRAGRGRDTCPLYGMGRDEALLREAWWNGYDAQDAEIGKPKGRARG